MGRPRKQKEDYYVATQGFATVLHGEQTFVAAGDVVAAGHPILKGREDLFKPWPGPRFNVVHTESTQTEEPVIEQATAAPGEKRAK